MKDEIGERHNLLPREAICERLCSTRFKIALLGFLGFATLFSMRVIMSIAIVEMVYDQGTKDGSYNENCPLPENSQNTSLTEGTFNWTTTQQANVLAARFYGNVITQIPGGYLASKYGGKHIMGYSLLINSILSILNPAFAYLGVPWLITLRVIEGMFEGMTLPAYSHLAARWSPELERTLFYGLSLSGCSFGIIFCYTTVGSLCMLDFLGGWPLGFILNGILGVIWFLAWNYTSANSPDCHPRISSSELKYILSTTQVNDQVRSKIPWKEMLKSPPFHAFVIIMISIYVVDYALLTGFPSYFSNVLNFDINVDGYLCSLFWFCNLLGSSLSSYFADRVRKRKIVSTTVVRKINQNICSIITAVFLILAGYAKCRSMLAVIFISMASFFFGFHYAGGNCGCLDIAPYFAGTVQSVAATIAALVAMFMPIVIDFFIKDNIHSNELWLRCFYFIGVSSVLGGVVYTLLGSGEVQPWGNPDKLQTEETEDTENN